MTSSAFALAAAFFFFFCGEVLASSITFEEFVQTHGREYSAGSGEFQERQALFHRRAAEVELHNRQGQRTWTAAVNALADRSDSELKGMRGYAHQGSSAGGRSSSRHSLQFLSKATERSQSARLPTNITWRPHLKAMSQIDDQGSCGSCWAFAAATTLRAHSELYRKDRSFSVQHLVSCTPNPRECGGQGGCQGATAELAVDYVKRTGSRTADEWSYSGMEEACPASLIAVEKEDNRAKFQSGGLASLGMRSYQKLPENELEPLMHALVNQGPIAVSIAASNGWNMYSSGVMEGCPKEDVINHAVVLAGYGEDAGKIYWLIQNSWGSFWGEGGFIRMQRQKTDKEEAGYCGWDRSPEVGSGCKGGPSKVWMCGTCGILYDTVVPNFDLSPDGWWARKGYKQVDGNTNGKQPVHLH